MNKESHQMIDFTTDCFNIPQSDRNVDYFFNDIRENQFIQFNMQDDNGIEEKLFSHTTTVKSQIQAFGFNSKEQQKKLQTKKKMKNTYASKIAKLIHQQAEANVQQSCSNSVKQQTQSQQQRLNYFQDSSLQSSSEYSSLDKKQIKLLKNRQSAQKSRKMKKQYIQILVDKVQQLQDQLATQRKINEKNAEKLKKYSYNEAILNGYFISRDQIMQKLQEAIKNKASQQQLNLLLDSVKGRFAGSGKERMNIIRYYYEQIFDLMVPDLSKYVVYSAVKNKGIFHNCKQKASELMKVMDVKGQKQAHIFSLKQSLIQSRQAISKIADELITAKQKLDQQARKIDDVFDQMCRVMDIEAQIRCVLFLQKNKYKPQFNSAWKDWKNIFLQKLDSRQNNHHSKKLIKTM